MPESSEPSLYPFNRFYFLDTEEMDFKPVSSEGITAKVLAQDPDTGRLVFIARFEPGATYHRHDHPQGEEIYVLSGEFVDEDRSYGSGSFLHYPTGTVHQPSSPAGCEILVVVHGARKA